MTNLEPPSPPPPPPFQPLYNQTNLHDLRESFVNMFKKHLKDHNVKRVLDILTSDIESEFFRCAYCAGRRDRFAKAGGLASAALRGYQALLMIHTAAKNLFTEVDLDRCVLIFLLYISGRYKNFQSQSMVYGDLSEYTECITSISTNALSNAFIFGISLTPNEVQAISRFDRSSRQLTDDRERFTVEWWILSQTVEWLYVAGRQ